jgi:DNA-binding NtrC family response regulator
MIDLNHFREDLYYRINTIEITSPPLRDRKDDILILAEWFLEEFKKKYARERLHFSNEFKDRLLASEWPGNVRELRNFIERAVILADSVKITPDGVAPAGGESGGSPSRSYTLSEVQKGFLVDVLEKNRWNIAKTAQELGVARSTVYNKLKQYGYKTRKYGRK